MKIIAISGPDGCGKSTLARSLKELIRGKSYVAPIAYVLRKELSDKLGIPLEELTKKPTSAPIRNLLRGYGEYQRSLDPYYWIDQWVEYRYKVLYSTISIVDDLRFIQEHEVLSQLGSVTISLVPNTWEDQPGDFYDIQNSSDFIFDPKPDPDMVFHKIKLCLDFPKSYDFLKQQAIMDM
jgi:energy-coupling factor transporter ATP-binding protein EcfA2